MLNYVDIIRLTRDTESFKETYENAAPFRHLVFDELVPREKLNALVHAFPDTQWNGWENVSHENQYLKMACDRIELIPDPIRTLIYELCSAPVLDWLTEVTGIPMILPDPLLIGGGMHVSGPGGTLTPHTDFHVVKGLSLYRRLNLLLYLNREWGPENGGQLELWDKKTDRVAKTVLPTLGTCVLFQTDNVSMHGFMTPVSVHNRQSIALYYYTAEDVKELAGDGATYWRYVSLANDPRSWMRLRTMGALMFASRIFSSLSWRSASLAQRMRR